MFDSTEAMFEKSFFVKFDLKAVGTTILRKQILKTKYIHRAFRKVQNESLYFPEKITSLTSHVIYVKLRSSAVPRLTTEMAEKLYVSVHRLSNQQKSNTGFSIGSTAV